MSRSALLRAAAALLLACLVALVPPGAGGAAPAHRRVAADTFGTPGTDAVLSLAAGGRLLVAGGYVTGQLPGQVDNGGTDAVIRVYSRGFTERWTRQIGTPGDDGTTSVATDGWVVVAGGWTSGDLGGPSGGHDESGWVKAFRPDGTERWSRRFGSVVTGVAVTDDAVYVAGRAAGRGQVKAYAPGGRLLWVHRLTSYFTPSVTRLAATEDRVFYTSGYTPIDSLHRTYLGSLDAHTGDEGWFTLHSTDGDQITALAAARNRVYVSSTTSSGLTAYESRTGYRAWLGHGVRIPGGERMRYATSILPGDDGLLATYIGYDSAALVSLSPRGHVDRVERVRHLWPESLVRSHGSLYVGGTTRAALDGPPAGLDDAVVARYETR